MKYGLLGHKIAYSLSPVIHKMINGSGIEYDILDISPESLKANLPQMTQGLSGFNVTIPHKQTVMEFCQEIDPLAERIGAVNTVAISAGRWKGYNTDYLGFIETVRKNIPDYFSFHPVVVGYGGVARAVIFGLQELGYKACSIVGGLNDDERKAFIKGMRPALDMNILELIPGMNRLWINCTPIGGAKHPDIPQNFIPYDNHDILYDLNYSPYPTYLEQDAGSKGLTTINGLKMLVAQAVEAQKIWNEHHIDLQCDTDEIIRSLVKGKNVS